MFCALIRLVFVIQSLHHGFMDENYENRPPAKNSGLATAKEAGVHDKDKKPDKETEAFLASIKHSSSKPSSIMGGDPASTGGKNKAAYVKTKPQGAVPPPPPPRPDDKASSLSYSASTSPNKSADDGCGYSNVDGKKSSFASSSDTSSSFGFGEYTYSSSKEYSSSSQAEASSSTSDWSGFAKKSKDMRPTSSSSFGASYTTNYGEGEGSQLGLNMNDYLDDFSDTGSTISETAAEQPSSYSSSHNNAKDDSATSDKGYAYDIPEKSSGQSLYSSSQKYKTTQQVSSLSSSSAFDQSMATQDVKSVYKDAFYRWNHPFRHDVTQEINGGVDVPMFWRIPRSASGVVEATMSYCYGLTLANAFGAGFQDDVSNCLSLHIMA